MTKLGRSTTIRFLVFSMLVLAATSWAQTLPPIAEQIAKTYGLDSFGQIEAIRYTFNLDLGDSSLLARGSGNSRRTGSHMKGKIRRASP